MPEHRRLLGYYGIALACGASLSPACASKGGDASGSGGTSGTSHAAGASLGHTANGGTAGMTASVGGTASAAGGAANKGGTANQGGAASTAGGTVNAGGAANKGGTANQGGTATTAGTTAATSGGAANVGGTAASAGAGGRANTSVGGSSAAAGTSSGGEQNRGGSTAAAGAAGWTENFAANTSPNITFLSRSASVAKPNVADAMCTDGRALQLQLAANVQPTPSGGVEAESKSRYRYGTFSARLRAASCSGQPNAGVVTGLFTYFNDGTDQTGDGLPDNSEIDFEWLCAEPYTVYLTMWTDYRDSDASQKRVSRKINLRTGAIAYTAYYQQFDDGQAISGLEAQPASLAPLANYDSSTAEYEYGFDWAADHVTWWFVNPDTGAKVTLWDYRGPAARIPSLASSYIVNVWHTADWPPSSNPNAIQSPTQPVSAWVDWMRYHPN